MGRECPTVYMPHFPAPVNIGFWKTPAPAPALCRAVQTRPRISHQKNRGAAAKSRTPVFPHPLRRPPPISSPGRTAAHLRRDSSSPPPVPTRSSIQQAESPVKSRARGREMGAADVDEVHLSRLRDRPPVFPPPPCPPWEVGYGHALRSGGPSASRHHPPAELPIAPPDTQPGHSAPRYPLQTRRNCLNAY